MYVLLIYISEADIAYYSFKIKLIKTSNTAYDLSVIGCIE